MNMKRAVIGAVVVLGAAGWYAFRPERLFVDQTVNESFAEAVQGAPGEVALASADIGAGVADAAGRPLVSGRFHSNAHETSGVATIHDLGSGRRILRLTEFATSNGPDVRIYLVAAGDVQDDATVKQAGFVELGPMKGNRGDQNYDIPAGLDLAKYRTVTVWCKRFSVNFGSAPLGAA